MSIKRGLQCLTAQSTNESELVAAAGDEGGYSLLHNDDRGRIREQGQQRTNRDEQHRDASRSRYPHLQGMDQAQDPVLLFCLGADQEEYRLNPLHLYTENKSPISARNTLGSCATAIWFT